WLLNKLFSPRNRRGVLAFIQSDEAEKQVEATRQAGERFFRSVLDWVTRQPRPAGRFGQRPTSDAVRVREAEIVPDVLSEELDKLASRVEAAGKDLEDEQKIEFTSLADRARALAGSVRQWLAQELAGQVYWVETASGPTPRLDLASAPIEVGPALREHLYER